MELRPYQQEAKAAILNAWKDCRRTLLVLPTGTGKTIVFSKVAEDRVNTGRVLILAHREELLTQAADKIMKSCGIGCAVEKAKETCLNSLFPITVGSVQTLQSERRLSNFPSDYFPTIIVDEAHHCLSDSYQRVLNHFPDAKVLGVTATPDRGDKKNLGAFFESLAYEYTLPEAIRQGYLCPIMVKTLPINIDLGRVKVSQGDYQAGDLGDALEPYLERIADAMTEHCQGRKTVVFLPLIATSQMFCEMLKKRGFRAAEVNGNSPDRAEILKDFDDGKYNVLCNSMLLTEGWDCPSVDCIVILRPTKVRGLYAQMVGRGTRLHPGKENLLLLDFLWMVEKHQLCKPACLIAENKQREEAITQKLEQESFDLLEAVEQVNEDAKAQREASLAREIKENSRKKSKCIDPMVIELSLPELADYEECFMWEAAPPSEKQLATLEKFGVDPTGIRSKGQASMMLDVLIRRSRCHMASVKQMNQLQKKGFKNVDQWSFEQASKMMGLLAKNRWMVPNWIDVNTYVPKETK